MKETFEYISNGYYPHQLKRLEKLLKRYKAKDQESTRASALRAALNQFLNREEQKQEIHDEL